MASVDFNVALWLIGAVRKNGGNAALGLIRDIRIAAYNVRFWAGNGPVV